MDDRFGCPACWAKKAPESALEETRAQLEITHRVIEDSHFGVSLRACATCGQPFLAIFTEFVDWSGGDDAQYFDLVPITAEEAGQIAAAGETVSLAYLGGLGAGRRRLAMQHPTGAPESIAWVTGPFVVTPGH